MRCGHPGEDLAGLGAHIPHREHAVANLGDLAPPALVINAGTPADDLDRLDPTDRADDCRGRGRGARAEIAQQQQLRALICLRVREGRTGR